jgi:cytochrome c biogenesis protein CcmG, thiol:disulfide interchange protein DsbE
MKLSCKCLLLLLLVSLSAWAFELKEGASAPRAVIKTLDGAHIDTAQLEGKVIIITFWATWCEYCHEELADLSTYYRDHAQEGLSIVAISVDEAEDAAKVRERARSYPFSVALLADADVSGYGRIWRLPLTFVIDRRGILRRDGWASSPAVTRAQMEETITPLLRDKD